MGRRGEEREERVAASPQVIVDVCSWLGCLPDLVTVMSLTETGEEKCNQSEWGEGGGLYLLPKIWEYLQILVIGAQRGLNAQSLQQNFQPAFTTSYSHSLYL